jgi:ubiquinone/menaquinone biosynthesis C-methylase UbiE
MAATHQDLLKALGPPGSQTERAAPENMSPSIELSSCFSISRLRPGQILGINLRVCNSGRFTLSSDGPNPIMLSYHWIDSAGATQEGLRTPLLDDLQPGRTVSIPVVIQAPPTKGMFKLRIRAIHENVEWLDHSTVEFEIDVAEGPSTVDEPAWDKTADEYDYMQDHRKALELLNEWRDRLFERPVSSVVEIGGNANPMIEEFSAASRVNVDVDPFGMMVGSLLRLGSHSPVQFVVADAMQLPFQRGSIDVLVMFATFHHFPEPIELLARCAEYVAQDGLICLMCEPVGHVHRDTIYEEYLREIRKGVNEQSFALWEYRQIFDHAGLTVAAARIDSGSAKFALRRAPARP